MSNPIAIQLKSLCSLTLEDIALRRVAVLLLRNPVKCMYLTVVVSERGEELLVSGNDQFKCSLSELGIPESMMGPLADILNPIFAHACKWLTFHVEFLSLGHSRVSFHDYTKHIRWTYMGTVNYRETARSLVCDEKLNVDKRFMLACLYCFGDDIRDLWKKLSPLSRKAFYNDGQPTRSGQARDIVVFWTCIIKRRVNKLIERVMQDGTYSSIYQYAFVTFAREGYETATQYFFENLNCEEREALLVSTTKAVASRNTSFFEPYNDISCYLLSQMNAEQFQNILEYSPDEILKLFLDWPRQDAFLEIAKLSLPYFKEHNYKQLHSFLTRTFECRYNSAKLFRDLFRITPKQFRYCTYYLNYFFRRQNTEIIKFVFRNMDPAEISDLIFNSITMHLCYKLVKEGKWEYFEFFIRESGLSKEDKERFTVAFISNFDTLLETETRERFTKVVNIISACPPKSAVSSCSEKPSGQPDEEQKEMPAKKRKKI